MSAKLERLRAELAALDCRGYCDCQYRILDQIRTEERRLAERARDTPTLFEEVS